MATNNGFNFDEKLAEIKELVKTYNDLKANNGVVDDIQKNIDDTDALVKVYNRMCCKKCFDELEESEEETLLVAVQKLEYDCIKVSDRRISTPLEEVRVERVVEEVSKPIDFEKLWEYTNKECGVDPNWLPMVHKLNLHLTAATAKSVGAEITDLNDSFAMHRLAKEIDMGKNPCSNNQMLKTLRSVVSAMIGEEYAAKVLSHDVAYLKAVYGRKSRKALTVTCANNRQLVAIVAEICHRLITGKKYSVEYKAAKK